MSHTQGHRKRLLDKFGNYPDSLHDYELLEAILFFSIPQKDTKPIAKKIFEQYKTFDEIILNVEKLEKIEGVGERTTQYFLLIKKLLEKITRAKVVDQYYQIESPETVVNYLKEKVAGYDFETFGVVFLDGENKIIEVKELFKGTIDKVVVHSRELIKEILEEEACSIILYHNHPKFINLEPSKADISLTNKIKKSISIIDVELLDHIIVSYSGFLSMKKEGIL